MNKIVLISIMTLWSLMAFGQKRITVKGNKYIVKKEFTISDYTSLGVAIKSEVHYTQMESDSPKLSIEIDENLLEHLIVEVENNQLKIKPERYTTLKPTKCIIYTNSKSLTKLETAGIVNTTIHDKLTADHITMSLAGKSEVVCNNLQVNTTEINSAGSATVTLAGSAKKSEFNIAGGGDIYTANFTQNEIEANIAGGGTMEVNVTDKLACSIAGSGTVKYKGNPTIKKSVVGFGRVKKMD